MSLRQGKERLVGMFCHAGKQSRGANLSSGKGSVDALPRPELDLQSGDAIIRDAILTAISCYVLQQYSLCRQLVEDDLDAGFSM